MTQTTQVARRLATALVLTALLGLPGFALASDAAGESPAETVAPRWSISMLEVLSRPTEQNVLKLFSTAVDAEHGRVYAAGILTPSIGILDTKTNTWVGTVDSGIGGYGLKHLEVDAAAGRVYVLNATRKDLRVISLGTDSEAAVPAVTGPVPLPSVFGAVCADPRRGLLYVPTSETPSFRAYDGATLELAWGVDAGPGISQIVTAGTGTSDAVYALDGAQAGPRGRILRIDPSRQAIAETISYSLPPGQRASRMAWDPTSQRFAVAVPGQFVSILSRTGREQRRLALPRDLDFQDLAFDPANGQVLVLALERARDGEVAGTGGRLLVWDATTGRMLADLACGLKPHSVRVDSLTGTAYIPNGDASILWTIGKDRSEAVPLRLGDSLEQVVPALAGHSLFLTSRLGGSYLVSVDADTGAFETFTAGTWPIPLRTDAAGEMLHVLNAWDGTVSVFELTPERRLVATIPTGLPRGTTDRLPDLAVDGVRKRAYAAYPEHGKVAVVDLSARAALAPIVVKGFKPGDTGGGPGQLQVLVNEAAGRLFVLDLGGKRLFVHDLAGTVAGVPPLVGTVALPKSPASAGSSFNLLFLDPEKSRLFIGPLEADAVTGALTGRSLPRGQRVFGLDVSRGEIWASASEAAEAGSSGDSSGQEVVAVLDAESLEPRAVKAVGSTGAIVPEFAYDGLRGRVYAAFMAEVLLNVYETHHWRP
ncbi:MAG: hypothetical protein DIJKHBIC_04493 [Thermoanaerobaculia bacterium]|nr:hypothetical protein [Thermoanaerobaculia bacterium]